MRFKVFAGACIFMSLAVFGFSGALAQAAPPGSLPAIDAATRAAIIDSITVIIDSVYVLEVPAKNIVAELRRAEAAGEYDELADPAVFARRLYEDCQRINHDGHFDIYAMQPLGQSDREARRTVSPEDVERRKRFFRNINYGFKKAEILTGGVAYIRLDGFLDGEDAFRTAVAAMNFVSNCNALILDLRYNGGGSASMIRLLCGYLFDESTHLINWDRRAEKKTVQSYSADYVPGKRITEQPVYVLTSERTFSAAEEFTFDLHNLERAVVVGDTTGGGGHTVSSYQFAFDGFRIGLRVPYGRAYNPLNNEGWEGFGIAPDIVVPVDDALDAAHAEALKKLIEVEQDERAKAVYRWSLDELEGKLAHIDLGGKELKKYAGSYGPRKVTYEDGALWYSREGGARHLLEPMGDDLFKVGDIGYFRLLFERDKRGRITKLIGVYRDGRRDENDRDGR